MRGVLERYRVLVLKDLRKERQHLGLALRLLDLVSLMMMEVSSLLLSILGG